MNALLLLIPIAMIFLAVAIGVFFWAVKSGQYDDLDTEGKRVLFDKEKTPRSSSSSDTDKR